MTRLVRATELMGLPVVTLDKAATVGEVRDVFFDPARSRVVALTVRGRGLLSPALIGLLPTGSVRSIGRDAVMIDTADSLVGHREGMSSAVDDQIEVIGKRVVTDNGGALGSVIDVVLEVDGGDAIVVGAEIERSGEGRVILPLPAGIPVSSDALVVPAASEPLAANGLGGFREVLARSRGRSEMSV
jgi:uncharacterized protein YrrD